MYDKIRAAYAVDSFNSKSGSIDRISNLLPGCAAKFVSIPKVVRLIVRLKPAVVIITIMFQFQKWFD